MHGYIPLVLRGPLLWWGLLLAAELELLRGMPAAGFVDDADHAIGVR